VAADLTGTFFPEVDEEEFDATGAIKIGLRRGRRNGVLL
jgi:hypothetical protein